MIFKRLLLLCSLLGTSSAFAQFSGNALDFDGTNDMVVVNTVPSLFSNPAANNFTIEAWVNPRGSLFTRIFFAQPSTTNFATLCTSTGNVIYFYVVVNGTTYSVATTTAITQNQWTHVAARWTASTNTPQVLFNGVVQPTIAGGSSSTGTSGLMTLGTRPGGAQYFNGALDEVRVWSEARNDCQILANMNLSITGTQPNLVVNYVFNQGIAGGNNTGATTLNDISGNTYNGTLTNFTLTSSTSNWISSGATLTMSGNPVNGISQSRSANVCSGGSLSFPDGSSQTNITAPFVQTSVVPGPGCDTIISTTVSVNAVYSINDSNAVCSGSSFTFPDGSTQNNITSVVNYTSTFQTVNGCDSLVLTHIDVLQASASSETFMVCPGSSHTFPDNTTQNNITSQVIYTSTLQNAAGCDSLVTTTVDVSPVYAANDSYTVCAGSSFTFADNTTQNNITATVVYTSMLTTVGGCDSTITTTIMVNQADTMVLAVNETLTANASGAVYQWLDCGNGYAILPGETNQSFTAILNGTYAVSVTMNGCTDTSSCFLILSTGIASSINDAIQIYPVPAHDLLYINTGAAATGTMELTGLTGELILRQSFSNPVFTVDLSGLAGGVYFVNLYTAEGKTVRKILKE